jgi:dihydroorotate dehydrogenase electron transfer subunit
MPKIIQGKFRILANKKVGRDYCKMLISAAPIAQVARPGQFIHLLCEDATDPLLRRPFSLHRFSRQNLQILYKIIGFGTNLLAKKQKGDKIDILGPLGNGFNIERPKGVPSASGGKSKGILIAGGMGVAPLLALAERLAQDNDILVLIGARTSLELLCAKEFRRLGVRLKLATDNGSLGHKGPVTDLLNKLLSQSTIDYKLSTIYACGPNPMLKAVAVIAKRHKITAYGSLEERMACGMGACLGCAVKTRTGYQRVCKDGPVFNLDEIEWDKEREGEQ